MKKFWILGAIAIGIMLGVAWYMVPEPEKNSSTISYKNRSVETDSIVLPAYNGAPAGSDSAEGLLAPSFEANDLKGNPQRVGKDGRAKLLIFLAHWCPHCQREVPLLVQDWIEEGDYSERVQIVPILVSIDPARPNYPPHTWLKKEKWPYMNDIVLDDKNNKLLEAYGGTSFPYFVLLDDQLRVRWRSSSEAPPAEIRARIKNMRLEPVAGPKA